MTSRRRQSQPHLDKVVDHQLRGDDANDMDKPRPGTGEEARDAALLPNVSHDVAEGLAATLALVSLGQDHVPGLGAEAGDDGSAKGGAEGYHDLHILAVERHGLREAVEHLGKNIKGYLKRIAKRVGIMGEDYCVSCGGGVPCMEVRAHVDFAACGGVVSSSLRSSLGLTCLPRV